MAEDMKTYLEEIKFEKYLKKLEKKLSGKKVVIYGSGSLFCFIKENYNLDKLNIIAISDMKFTEEDESREFLGYKTVPKSKIKDFNPDAVIVATLHYVNIIDDFETEIFNGTKTKVLPLAKMKFWDLIKEIWNS